MTKGNSYTDNAPYKLLINTKDGQAIHINVYEPESPANSTLLISNAPGADQKCYQSLSLCFCRKGIRVITFDYRGTGLSELMSGRASLYHWAVEDLDAIILFAKSHFPKQEIAYMGHGWAGQLVGLAPASLFFDRLLLVDCALTKFDLPSMMQFIQLFYYKMIGYNLPLSIIKKYLKWMSRKNGLFDFHSGRNFRKFQRQILVCSTSTFESVDFSKLEQLVECFRNAKVDYLQIPDLNIYDKISRTENIPESGEYESFCQLITNWLKN